MYEIEYNISQYYLLEEIFNDKYFKNMKSKLYEAWKKSINLSYCEYMSGEKEHDYSNLYSCIYYLLKEEKQTDLMDRIDDLINLKYYYDLNIRNEGHLHNFKIERKIGGLV